MQQWVDIKHKKPDKGKTIVSLTNNGIPDFESNLAIWKYIPNQLKTMTHWMVLQPPENCCDWNRIEDDQPDVDDTVVMLLSYDGGGYVFENNLLIWEYIPDEIRTLTHWMKLVPPVANSWISKYCGNSLTVE